MNRRVPAAFAAATLLASTLTVTTGAPALAATPADEVATIGDGLTQLAGWLDDVGTFGDLAAPMPLLDLAPGGADALDLAGHFGSGGPFLTGLAAASGSLADGDGLAEFAAALSAQPGVDATAVALDSLGIGGLDVTLTHTVSVADAPLVVLDDTGIPVDLRSVAADGSPLGPGIPVELTLTATFELRTDVDTDEFWLVHRPDTDAAPTPRLVVDADVDGFDFPAPATDPFTSAIGIARVTLTDDSSLDLDAAYTLDLADSDGDGRLAFMELAGDGVTAVPGELTAQLDQIIEAGAAGSVVADLGITFDRIAVSGLAGTPRVTVTGDLATGGPSIAVNADYEELTSFLEIGATELLGGLGQLSMMLTGLQHRPGVDVDLPFLDVDLADALPIAGDLADFVLAHSLDDDPATLVNEFGSADFATLDELVELLEAELPLVGDLAPTFEAGTDRLRLPVHLESAPSAPEPVTVTDLDGTPTPAGSIAFSETLPDHLGWLEGLTSAGGPVAQRQFGYDLAFTLGIDLRPAVACTCDDPFTEEFIEVEEPAIYERFLIGEAASGPEASITAAIGASVASLSGSIGFVTVEAQSGELNLGSTTDPIFTLDLSLDDTATSGAGDLVPIYAVLRSFSSSPLAGYAIGAVADATIPADLELVLGVPVDGALLDLGGATTAGVAMTWADLTDSLVPTTSTPIGSLELLTGFALDPTDPNALLGVLLDHLGTMAAELAGLSDGVPVLDDEIPFTTVRPKELLEAFDDLSQAITTLRGGVEPETLQELVAALESELGGDLLDLSVADVGADGTPDLVVGLDLSHPIAQELPLGLELSGLGDLVGVGSTGRLQVTGDATVDLEFPIPVSLAGLPTDPADLPLSETSVVGLSLAGLLDQDVAAGVTLAGVDVTLGDGGQARVGFDVTAAADDGDDTDDGVTTVGDFVSALVTTGPTLTAAGGLTCETTHGTTAVTGDLLCAAFPVEVAGTALDGGDGTVDDADLLRVSADGFDPSGWTVEPPSGIAALLSSFSLDLGSLPELVDRLATLLTAAMRIGGDLPVVGEQLDAGADVVEQVQTEVRDAVDDAMAVTGTVEDVRNTLESTLATTLVGSGILLPSDYDGDATDAVDIDDVRISLLDSSGAPFVDETTTNSVEIADVKVEFGLGQGDPGDLSACATCTATLPLSTGLPALQLRTSGELSASYGWAIHLGFGVSREDGPYLLENPRPPLGGDDAGDALPELELATEAGLGGGGIGATLGVFEFTVSDVLAEDSGGADASGISLGLTANLDDPSGSTSDDRITLMQLPALAAAPATALQPQVTFDADFRLGLEATAGTGLPRVRTVLDLEWQPFGATPDPRVAFDGFDIALGSLFGETFEPILSEVRRLTGPVDPIREFLFAPLPVLSEVSRMFGGDDVTFVDLAELFGETDLSLLEDINDVVEVAQVIADAGLSDGWIPVGDGFFVDADAASGDEPTSSQAAGLVSYTDPHGIADKTVPDPIRDDAAAELSGDDALFAEDAGDDPADFLLPVIDDPSCLFGMLLGGDCTILEWRPDPLELEFSYEQPFGPFFGVLYVTIGGYAGAGAQFGIGFDTHGARRLIESG
ncbi:MAG: hypothetical protein KY461_09340, partial [Actinobacteria bacterium]|nr:hypothetical protein [Actinomycetota bacterium]